MYELRDATDMDGDAIGALIEAAFNEHPGCVYDRDAEYQELDAIASYFRDSGGQMWIGTTAETKVSGSCGILPVAPDKIELHKLYVSQDARGIGIATALLNKAIEFAKAQDASELFLWTDTRFLAGQRFYEKHGFTKLPGTRQLDDLSKSVEFCYRLALSSAGAD